jgi:hypothetical protein
MDVKLGLICDYANISQDGKLNVMGIFSRILAPQFPVTHPIMHLVIIFAANSPEKGRNKELQLQLLDEDGNSLMNISGNFQIPNQPGPTIEMQQIFALQMLQFKNEGNYAFHILINGETKATIPLQVAVHQQQGQQAPPS